MNWHKKPSFYLADKGISFPSYWLVPYFKSSDVHFSILTLIVKCLKINDALSRKFFFDNLL